MSTPKPKAKRRTREAYLTTPVTSKDHLPSQGLSRAKDILPFLPFGRTTLHEWSRDGRFPKSVKLSETVVAWRNSEVIDWLANCTSYDEKPLEKESDGDSATDDKKTT